jgi:pyruvate/2-oxoglutarate dehydrogenase complex dihydrolipoamide acyltransferase (E2) component
MVPIQSLAEETFIIARWFVKSGDRFNKGNVLAEIESIKTIYEFEAPCNGVVSHILEAENESITYGKPIIEIETVDDQFIEYVSE